MAVQVEVPSLGESVTQATLIAWHKKDGDTVAADEPICELETDKANVDIPAKSAGVVHHLKHEGDTVHVGEVIARIDESPAVSTTEAATPPAKQVAARAAEAPAPPPVPAAAVATAPTPLEDLSPAVRRLVEEYHLDSGVIPATGPNGRLTKEDVENFLVKSRDAIKPGEKPPVPVPPPVVVEERRLGPTTPPPLPAKPAPAAAAAAPGVRREPMSKIRQRIAQRLVEAQQTAAILTTFNEIDLSEVIALRAKFKDQFEKIHGVGLGFMSFFVRATVQALRQYPAVNASIDGADILYHDYVNLGIAVSTDRGLAVPVLRNVQEMSFAKIESEIKRLAAATRDGKLSLEELSGATFTITNGGVFGSLLSTPILTPPQSGILGMHAIQKRPVVINDKVEVRSMMYVALSYDHRIVDGKEAISFLVRIKQLLEDPARLMLEV